MREFHSNPMIQLLGDFGVKELVHIMGFEVESEGGTHEFSEVSLLNLLPSITCKPNWFMGALIEPLGARLIPINFGFLMPH